MQPPLNFPCANCGAHLVIDGSTPLPICAYCHTQTALPREVWAPFEAARAEAAEVARVGAMRAAMLKNAAASKKVSAWVFAVPAVALAALAIFVVFIVEQKSSPVDPLASSGDPCNGRTAACSKDKKADLQCGAGDKMVVTNTCKGPNGCRPSTDGTSISCDYTLADPKDPCDTTDDSCSTDHKAELACVAGFFSVRATCKGPDGCRLTPAQSGGYTLSCDDHIADVGDPCFDSERTACSSDKKSLLTCTAQKYVVDRTCKGPHGCTMTKDVGGKTMTVDCDGPSR